MHNRKSVTDDALKFCTALSLWLDAEASLAESIHSFRATRFALYGKDWVLR